MAPSLWLALDFNLQRIHICFLGFFGDRTSFETFVLLFTLAYRILIKFCLDQDEEVLVPLPLLVDGFERLQLYDFSFSFSLWLSSKFLSYSLFSCSFDWCCGCLHRLHLGSCLSVCCCFLFPGWNAAFLALDCFHARIWKRGEMAGLIHIWKSCCSCLFCGADDGLAWSWTGQLEPERQDKL